MKKYIKFCKLKRCMVKNFLDELSPEERSNTELIHKIIKFEWVRLDHKSIYMWLRNHWYDGVGDMILVDPDYLITKQVEILPWYKKIIWYLTSKLTRKVDRNQTQN